MTVENVSNSEYWYKFNNQQNNSESAKSSNNTIGKDAFLNLLVTQLKNQDPLNPMDDKEFIAQMAQFTTLEQIQNLDKNLQESQEEIKKAINELNTNYSQSQKNTANELALIRGTMETYRSIIDNSLVNQNAIISKLDMIKNLMDKYLSTSANEVEQFETME